MSRLLDRNSLAAKRRNPMLRLRVRQGLMSDDEYRASVLCISAILSYKQRKIKGPRVLW